MFARHPAARLRVEALEDRRTPAAGDLDLSFAGDGVAVNPVGAGSSIASDLAIQADGRIVVVGQAYTSSPANVDFAVVRYRPDGSLDPTFGAGGKVTTSFAKFVDEAKDVVIQPDGKIIVAGYANLGRTSSGSGRDDAFALARYLPGGALDTSFGKNGLVTTQLAKSAPDSVSAIVLRPDGKIVAVGSSNGNIAAARYTPSGKLDPTFDGDGIFVHSRPGSNTLHAAALLPDGRMVAVGSDDQSAGLVVRINANGGLDPTFGTGGVVAAPIWVSLEDLAVAPDGKIVAGGWIGVAGPSGADRVVARFNPDGGLDPTFGEDRDGDGTRDGYSQVASGRIYGLSLDPAGRIVTAGFVFSPDSVDPAGSWDRDFAVFRYTPDGLPDPTFGSDGVSVTDVSGTDAEYFFGIALQGDGRIVAAGAAVDPATQRQNIAVARFLGDDPSVAPLVSIAPPVDLTDPDDRWAVGGPDID